MAPFVLSCSVNGCGFETVKTELEMPIHVLGLHHHLARQQLLAFHQKNAHNHVQEVAIKPLHSDQKTVQQPVQQVPGTQQPDRHEQDMVQDPIASKDSTYFDRQVQLRMSNDNILLSPLTLLGVQQASNQIEVAKDISTMPVDTAQGMSSNEPDLAQKEVATKPLETALY